MLDDIKQQFVTTQLECLAIKWSVLPLSLYPEENRLTIRTDHGTFKRILDLTDSTKQQARWRLRIFKFEFDVVHRAGNKHGAADVLSRLNKTGQDEGPPEDNFPLYAISSHDNLTHLVHAAARDVGHGRNVSDNNLSDDEA